MIRSEKSVTVVSMGDDVEIREIPLKPMRDVRKVRGRLDDILEAAKSETDREDFIYAELTDEPVNAMQRMREFYPNTVHIKLIRPEVGNSPLPDIDDIRNMDPMVLFEDIFRHTNGIDITEGQRKMVRELMEKAEVRL